MRTTTRLSDHRAGLSPRRSQAKPTHAHLRQFRVAVEIQHRQLISFYYLLSNSAISASSPSCPMTRLCGRVSPPTLNSILFRSSFLRVSAPQKDTVDSVWGVKPRCIKSQCSRTETRRARERDSDDITGRKIE